MSKLAVPLTIHKRELSSQGSSRKPFSNAPVLEASHKVIFIFHFAVFVPALLDAYLLAIYESATASELAVGVPFFVGSMLLSVSVVEVLEQLSIFVEGLYFAL
jgi:hypothetical protein